MQRAKIGVKIMKLKEKWTNRLGALLLYAVLVLGVIALNARIEYLNTVMK